VFTHERATPPKPRVQFPTQDRRSIPIGAVVSPHRVGHEDKHAKHEESNPKAQPAETIRGSALVRRLSGVNWTWRVGCRDSKCLTQGGTRLRLRDLPRCGESRTENCFARSSGSLWSCVRRRSVD